ncbi:hypothetical protein [Streptomyces sp. NPDC088184]|uniref:hypothetical protein n=1 Tax=unclassified Streptomyces TaxID=2593676 RepID=UPI0034165FC7
MALLRKTITQDELRDRLPADEQESGPVYQSLPWRVVQGLGKAGPRHPEAGDRPVSAARRAVRVLARLAHVWQCSQCGAWFESDTGSQTCPSCG